MCASIPVRPGRKISSPRRRSDRPLETDGLRSAEMTDGSGDSFVARVRGVSQKYGKAIVA
jgi:hypothetical protein